jgi:hypothetical protein
MSTLYESEYLVRVHHTPLLSHVLTEHIYRGMRSNMGAYMSRLYEYECLVRVHDRVHRTLYECMIDEAMYEYLA